MSSALFAVEATVRLSVSEDERDCTQLLGNGKTMPKKELRN